MRLLNVSIATLLPALLAACSVDANYTLNVEPVVAGNQEPFQGGPMLRLRIRDADGNIDWFRMGELSSGEVSENGFPPLDHSTVGLTLSSDSNRDDEPDPLGISAYGVSAPLTIAKGNENVTTKVLVSHLGGFAALGSLPEPRLGAGAALTERGSVFVFGGAPRNMVGGCGNTILKMDDLNSGDWTFRELDIKLPVEHVCAPQVVITQLDGREVIMVKGGESEYSSYTLRQTYAILIDPITEQIIWEGKSTLAFARDLSIQMPSGKIMFVGANVPGATSGIRNAQIETFDPQTKEWWYKLDPLEVMAWGFMASKAPGGAAICGGMLWQGSDMTPQTTCKVVSEDGVTTNLPDLPTALAYGQMVTLEDGRLLIAGGTSQPVKAGALMASQGKAWILDPGKDSAWGPAGSMNTPRTHFRMYPDNMGGAVIIGGADKAWGYSTAPAGQASCGERWVPTGGGTFTDNTECAAGNTGIRLVTAYHQDMGVFSLEGRLDNVRDTAANDFGHVSLGPRQ